jgi:hypothetical protein
MPYFFLSGLINTSDQVSFSKTVISIKKEIDLNFMVYSYAVLSPLNPNCLFDISDVWELKKKNDRMAQNLNCFERLCENCVRAKPMLG